MKVSGIVALLLLFACASTSWSAPFPMQMLPGHVVVDTSNAASLHTNSAKVNRTLPTPDTPSVKHRVLLSEPPRPNPQSNSKSSEEPAATPAAVVNGLKPHSKNPVLFDLSHLDGSGFFTEPDFWEKVR